MPLPRCLRAAAITLSLVLLTAPDGWARRLAVDCADGDPACDLDRTCDGVCRLVVRTRPAVRLTVPLRRRGPARRVRRVGRHLIVARCRPAETPCKPPLTSGCHLDLPADDCAARAGDYGQRGLNPTPACHCRTEDGGAPCTRDTDCQGVCFAPFGEDTLRCSTHMTQFGCFTTVDARGERVGLCVD
jgi:hypothetical protein